MSKGGGAGKVYFVLYLAVVLELLIIIVERDEAEEGLHKKQKETMRIVESILSQLQSGAGTEGINTRPQDEITVPEPGINIKEVMGSDIKSFRRYTVEVGVTDISSELKRGEETEKEYLQRLEKLVKLGNVEELEYQIWFNPSQESFAPLFPNEAELKKRSNEISNFQPGQTLDAPDGAVWELLSIRRLKLNEKQTFTNINTSQLVTSESIIPVYPHEDEVTRGDAYAPPNTSQDSVFYYSQEETYRYANTTSAAGLKKRAFVVNFQPPRRAGWYKLRFASRTNRILGVRGDTKPTEVNEESTVNIGTVQLTVRDLEKVKKELILKLEKFDLQQAEDVLRNKQDVDAFNQLLEQAKKAAEKEENRAEYISKIDLFGYIAKLLAPGQSINFDQNRGSIEFNIRVVTPSPDIPRPTIVVQEYIASFDAKPAVFDINVGNLKPSSSIDGVVYNVGGGLEAKVLCKPLGQLRQVASTQTPTGSTAIYFGKVTDNSGNDKVLSPGKYNIVVTHRIAGQEGKDTATLEIFKTALLPENEELLTRRLARISYAQEFILFNAMPTSGGKIKPDQFRIFLATDKDQGKEPIRSLTVTRDNSIYIKPDISKASIRIAWEQPLTGDLVDLYPLKEVEIVQQPPTFNFSSKNKDVKEISKNRYRVTINNIQVVPPNDGVTETSKAKIEVTVGNKVTLGNTMSGVTLNSEPQIQSEGAKIGRASCRERV